MFKAFIEKIDNSFLKLEQRVIDELKIINEIMKKLI